MKRMGGLITALALVAPVLLACGGDDGDDTGSGDEAGEATTDAGAGGNGGEPAEGGPVTIEHRYGETTLDAPPERIVSLDTQWTDVLTALDAPLVGAALDPYIEGGRYPWQEGAIGDDVEGIPVTDTVPFEAVAALQPDLIVITFLATEQSTYDTLSEIAPTIPLLGDEEVDAWQDIATTAGEALGRPDDAAALVEDAEQLTAEIAAELPGLQGRTYSLANYAPGDALYVVADPEDGASTFFSQLGVELDPEILELADGAAGRVELSLEQVDELDSDLLLLLTNDADPADIPGYELLPAVETDAVAILDLAQATAINTPSPLSIPWVLDAIRPALEAADAAA